MANGTSTGPLGYESAVINGQLLSVAPGQAINPLSFGQSYAGSQMWPNQGVYQIPPVMPSPTAAATTNPASYGSITLPTATDSSGSPFSITKGPIWFWLICGVIGFLLLRYIHFH
jgi:hypothetical protein